MPRQTITSAQALAQGALVAGVKVVTSYPGSPSSETVDELIELAGPHGLHVEWSSNEKVAMEIGIGVSIAGRRALVCTKSVGMNAMVDPLMVLNLTPVHGGLVILLGDDPGGYGSQNDQDTRPIASMVEMPMMEPATPAEGFAMMRAAFELSERFHTAVIVRETRSFTQQAEPVDIPPGPYSQPNLGLVREPWRFVPVPKNVVKKHRDLHQRLTTLEPWANHAPFNRIDGTGARGIIAAGFVYQKLLDVIGDAPHENLRLLKLGVLYPLPRELVSHFLVDCHQVLVLEENEPYLETQIKAIAHESGRRARIFGKQTGHVHREGELFRWQIHQALERFLPGFTPARTYLEQDEATERPPRENHCAGCRFGVIVDALRDVAAGLGQNPVLIADPGCLTPVADRIDAKFAIGSAVGVAEGLARVGIGERAVALFGDSSFFHTALPAIVNAVHQRSDILMVILDNGATVTSGFQPHPGVARDARGRSAPALDIERIARACGVDDVHTVGPDHLETQLRPLFHDGLTHPGLKLIVARSPCDHPRQSTNEASTR
jgi:indolepyruvate ferredoxin oxidoreductase, alpha subunit